MKAKCFGPAHLRWERHGAEACEGPGEADVAGEQHLLCPALFIWRGGGDRERERKRERERQELEDSFIPSLLRVGSPKHRLDYHPPFCPEASSYPRQFLAVLLKLLVKVRQRIMLGHKNVIMIIIIIIIIMLDTLY